MQGGPDLSVLDIDAPTIREKLVQFIRTQMASTGFKHGIIGLSGGLDSTVTAYLTVAALGADNVIGLIMPYRSSDPQSQRDAQQVADHLQISSHVMDITPQIDTYFAQFPEADRIRRANKPEADRIRRANKIARERMSILYDQSRIYEALVIGTGNKSERLLGYTTLWGDMACAFSPLGDLYKTQVRQLANELGVTEVIRNKPPSAGLWPGQTDEGELGFSYAEADQILYWLIDQQYDVEQVAEKGFPLDLVTEIATRVKRSAFKSRMPPVAQI